MGLMPSASGRYQNRPVLSGTPITLTSHCNFAPVTVQNRSFIIKLKRKMPHEEVEDFVGTIMRR
jgi:hypothetical protein